MKTYYNKLILDQELLEININKSNSIGLPSNLACNIKSLPKNSKNNTSNNLTFTQKFSNLLDSIYNKLALSNTISLTKITYYIILNIKLFNVEDFDIYCNKINSIILLYIKEIKNDYELFCNKSLKDSSSLETLNSIIDNIIITFNLTVNFLNNLFRLKQDYNDKQKNITKQFPNLAKNIFKIQEYILISINNHINIGIKINSEKLLNLINIVLLLNTTISKYYNSIFKNYEKNIKNYYDKSYKYLINYEINNKISTIDFNNICFNSSVNKVYKILLLNFSTLRKFSNNENEKCKLLIKSCFNNITDIENISKPKDIKECLDEVNSKISTLGIEKLTLCNLSNYICFYFDCIEECLKVSLSSQKVFEIHFNNDLLKELNTSLNVKKLVKLFKEVEYNKYINDSNYNHNLKGLNNIDFIKFNIILISKKLNFLSFLIENFNKYVILSSYKEIEYTIKLILLNSYFFSLFDNKFIECFDNNSDRYTFINLLNLFKNCFLYLIKTIIVYNNTNFLALIEEICYKFLFNDVIYSFIYLLDCNLFNKNYDESLLSICKINLEIILNNYLNILKYIIESNCISFYSNVFVKNLLNTISYLIPKDYIRCKDLNNNNNNDNSSNISQSKIYIEKIPKSTQNKVESLLISLFDNYNKFVHYNIPINILKALFPNLEINLENIKFKPNLDIIDWNKDFMLKFNIKENNIENKNKNTYDHYNNSLNENNLTKLELNNNLIKKDISKINKSLEEISKQDLKCNVKIYCTANENIEEKKEDKTPNINFSKNINNIFNNFEEFERSDNINKSIINKNVDELNFKNIENVKLNISKDDKLSSDNNILYKNSEHSVTNKIYNNNFNTINEIDNLYTKNSSDNIKNILSKKHKINTINNNLEEEYDADNIINNFYLRYDLILTNSDNNKPNNNNTAFKNNTFLELIDKEDNISIPEINI